LLDDLKANKWIDPQAVRKLPSFIDVFFYPISTPGLTILTIYVFTPVIFHLIESWLGTILGASRLLLGPTHMLFTIINLIVTVYLIWYFNKCIHQSALGKMRAPEILSTDLGESIVDVAFQLLRIACCLLVCLVPAVVYCWIVERSDWICYLLLACGIGLMPMALLATTMFSSLCALNPILIISSICTTFLRYCLVWLALCLPLVIGLGLMIYLPNQADKTLSFILRGVYAYLLLVAAHILGRFYYRNEKKLYWSV
jgi:hypothetical protein